MIWGHEAGEGGKRDGRGPWKVSQMFCDPGRAKRVLAAVTASSGPAVADAYKALLGSLPRCGPNFFTKHLYFLGKAARVPSYPIILDNRVASGLARLAGLSSLAARMVDVSATRTVDAYLAYLRFVHAEAARIGCEPDQIEMFLFNAAGDA